MQPTYQNNLPCLSKQYPISSELFLLSPYYQRQKTKRLPIPPWEPAALYCVGVTGLEPAASPTPKWCRGALPTALHLFFSLKPRCYAGFVFPAFYLPLHSLSFFFCLISFTVFQLPRASASCTLCITTIVFFNSSWQVVCRSDIPMIRFQRYDDIDVVVHFILSFLGYMSFSINISLLYHIKQPGDSSLFASPRSISAKKQKGCLFPPGNQQPCIVSG